MPILTKREWMAHFNRINTAGLDRDTCMELAVAAERNKTFDSEIGQYAIGLSTGTSGSRGLFVTSESERTRWVANVFYRVIRWQPRRQRVAFCLRANSKLYESVRSVFFGFRFYDVANPVAVIAEGLQAQQPHILCAQPSLLRALALLQQGGRLSLSPLQVVSYAEVLDPSDRRLIEATFGQPITEIYQCTEGFLGSTCRYGTLHLHEDLVYIERRMLDERRFEPILTDYTRTTQPIVRYLLNDVLVLRDTPCPCGSPLTALSHIEGRADDTLELDGQVVLSDLMRRRIVLASGSIRDYAVHQVGHDQVVVYLEATDHEAAEAAVCASLASFFVERAIRGVGVSVRAGVPTHEPGTKRRRARRL